MAGFDLAKDVSMSCSFAVQGAHVEAGQFLGRKLVSRLHNKGQSLEPVQKSLPVHSDGFGVVSLCCFVEEIVGDFYLEACGVGTGRSVEFSLVRGRSPRAASPKQPM